MIDEITQNISPVTPLPGLLVENRPAAVNQLVEEELPLLSTQLETLVGQLNTTISQTNIAVDIAANAAVISNSLSNYVGEWSTLVSYDKNQTTSIGTLYYISKVDNNLNHIVTDTNYWLPNPVNTKIDYNMSGYTEKVTPVDTDLLPLSDSAATFGIKKLTWANIKATLKTYFDTLYLALTGAQTVDGVKTFSSSPIVPTPTSNTQAANKAYVDSASGGAWSANDTRAKTALNATGTAPIYACRAWVNFNGTGTISIRGSGNVSSVGDGGTGDYTVNFITAMQDANFAALNIGYLTPLETATTASSYKFQIYDTNANPSDHSIMMVSVFR